MTNKEETEMFVRVGKWCNEINLKSALDAFLGAAANLSEVWEQTDHTGDYLIDGYPFEKSFDEVVHDIIDWRDAQSVFYLKDMESGLIISQGSKREMLDVQATMDCQRYAIGICK